MPFASEVIVCERDFYCYKEKIRNGIPPKVELYKGSLYKYLLDNMGSKFDVANLDLCCNYSIEVYKTLSLLIGNNMLNSPSLLFLSLNPYSLNQLASLSIAHTAEEIKARFVSQINNFNYGAEKIETIPETYFTTSKANKIMHSFGWKLERKD